MDHLRIIENVVRYGKGYWSIYETIRESNLPECEKIECYKDLMQRIENDYPIFAEESYLWKILKIKTAKKEMKNIHKREFII
jgi:hypothetical protein